MHFLCLCHGTRSFVLNSKVRVCEVEAIASVANLVVVVLILVFVLVLVLVLLILKYTYQYFIYTSIRTNTTAYSY